MTNKTETAAAPTLTIAFTRIVTPEIELVDLDRVEVSQLLCRDTYESEQAMYDEAVHYQEMIEHRQPVPQIHLLKLGPRRFRLLRGRATLLGYKRTRESVASCIVYRVHPDLVEHLDLTAFDQAFQQQQEVAA